MVITAGRESDGEIEEAGKGGVHRYDGGDGAVGGGVGGWWCGEERQTPKKESKSVKN